MYILKIVTVLAMAWPMIARADQELNRLNLVVNEYMSALKTLDPYDAPYFNVEKDFDKFGDYPSPAFRTRRENLLHKTLEKINTIDPVKLNSSQKIYYELFRSDIATQINNLEFGWWYLDFNQMGSRMRSYLDDSSPNTSGFPFKTVKNFNAWIKRSEGFPAYVDYQIALLKEGIEKKIILNCVNAEKTLASIQEGAEETVEKHPFYRPLSNLPKGIKKSERERLTAETKKMIAERIVPGFKKFIAFYKGEYLPQCRKDYGIYNLPNYKNWYKQAIVSSTGLDLTPEYIHELGKKEVARIRGEIEKIKLKSHFTGTLTDFLKYRTKDANNYFTSKNEMIDAFKKIKKEVDVQLPKYFSLLPKSEYMVVEGENPADAAARYIGPTEVKPYGRFVINAFDLHNIDKSSTTSLSMHEAAPGHHLQIALQYEMKNKLSEYQRKVAFNNAFAEGWALYAEYLGQEMGMYKDQDQLLGHYTEEIWRAVRLVVDTGIHHYGWSRTKVIQYMKENMVADDNAIEIEADRYSVWPGQALGYKIGQLKILELRQMAENKLGKNFDIKGFHAAAIGNGTVTLPLLEKQIHIWVEETLASKNANKKI